ncbi:MAG: BatA domain-containing protein [Verrucomicrobiales bacterium]
MLPKSDMSFLAPLFLLGSIAIIGPIIFHLVKKSSKEHVWFSSLMFLAPSPPTITRKSRLEHWLLLLLRVLILGLVALAFARPFMSSKTPVAATSGTTKRVAILIDRSASMNREGIWSQAINRAREVIDNANPADRLALFTFDQQLNTVVGFGEADAAAGGNPQELARTSLDGLRPGWGIASFGNALLRASELANDAGSGKDQEVAPATELYLISDFASGSRLDGLQGFEWPRGSRIIPLQVKPASIGNAGISMLPEISSFSGNTSILKVRAFNASESKNDQFELSWFNGAEAVGQKVSIYLPAGQSRTFTAPLAPTNATLDTMRLLKDMHAYDNQAFFTPTVRQQTPIYYLGTESSADPAQPLFYLERAFRTEGNHFQVHPLTNHNELHSLQNRQNPFIVAAAPLDAPTIQSLTGILTNGGALLMALPNEASVASLAQLLKINGSGTVAPLGQNRGYALVGNIDFNHPLFTPFADPRFSDFTKIHFWKYRRLPPELISVGKTLMTFDTQDPLLLEYKLGNGTVFVATSSWIPGDSQLALSSKFVPLLFSMLEQTGWEQQSAQSYLVGASIVLPTKLFATNQTVTVLLPNQEKVQVAAGETFSRTERPGIYQVVEDPSYRFAVNLDLAESNTTPMETEELQNLGLPLNTPAGESILSEKQALIALASELEGQQKYWRWMIATAVGLLLLETLFSGYYSARRVLA